MHSIIIRSMHELQVPVVESLLLTTAFGSVVVIVHAHSSAQKREERGYDFSTLDANGGRGWDLLQKLIAERGKRSSVGSVLNHPFLR